MGTTTVDICQGDELPSAATSKHEPMRCVSWCDAALFLNRLSEQNGYQPVYSFSAKLELSTDTNRCNSEAVYTAWNPTANGYRFPTEAEWEYAARASFTGIYAGASDVDAVAWWSGNSSQPQPVAQLEQNAWGLHDMSGNVWEWTWDHYDLYLPGRSVDPKGPIEDIDQDGRKIVRGGSYKSDKRCSGFPIGEC